MTDSGIVRGLSGLQRGRLEKLLPYIHLTEKLVGSPTSLRQYVVNSGS